MGRSAGLVLGGPPLVLPLFGRTARAGSDRRGGSGERDVGELEEGRQAGDAAGDADAELADVVGVEAGPVEVPGGLAAVAERARHGERGDLLVFGGDAEDGRYGAGQVRVGVGHGCGGRR